MVELKRRADPDSLDISRDGKHVGFLQWHSCQAPRIILSDAFAELSLSELGQILEEYEEVTGKPVMVYGACGVGKCRCVKPGG